MRLLGESIIRDAKEALAFAERDAKSSDYRIHIPDEINVKRIRKKLGMSQKVFADMYGFSVRTIQEWEQGRMVPSGPARMFLVVLDREPAAVSRALS